MGIVRRFINANLYLSDLIDSKIFSAHSLHNVDGNTAVHQLVRKHVKKSYRVYDVGGGKRPFFSVAEKLKLKLNVIGIDVSSRELASAPDSSYDETVVSSIESFEGRGDGDLVVCIAVLEHVSRVDDAIESISSILKPGGGVVIFVPCRNAVFARLNLLLPEKLKKALLYGVFPNSQKSSGFKSYYNCCTPSDMQRICLRKGLVTETVHVYFNSGYFRFFLPLHMIWRCWSVIARHLFGSQACETFTLILRKKEFSTAREVRKK